ncbi:MAG: tetratricopeptide repeat protein [Gemmatimonadota bacterium]|nr:tetratricopeptide repeat protein [Gemmatimonadota bacterium]
MRERGLLLRLADAQALLESGQHAALLGQLSMQPQEDLERFPELMVLCAIAHARLGQLTEGVRWAQRALDRAVARGHRAVEVRTHNVLGAIALDGGKIDDATRHFIKAIAAAKREGDHGTVGRSAGNLGVIATMCGDYARAIGWYTMALTAYQRMDIRDGTAEVLNNLAITYRDMGDYDRALVTADSAVDAAEAAGERRLANLAYGCRAEIRLLAGDVELARREIEQALERERVMGDVVGETEDLRVFAGTEAAKGRVDEALGLLRDVIERANSFPRPLLLAQAERDLARMLYNRGEVSEALAVAQSARDGFSTLGVRIEVAKLDALIAMARVAHPGRAGRQTPATVAA